MKPQTKIAQRANGNLGAMLALLKQEASHPPPSAASALARAAGQIATLAAIYDEAAEEAEDGLIELGDWCREFIASLERRLARDEGIAIKEEKGRVPRLPLAQAQSIGLLLGELIADAYVRARASGQAARIEIGISSSPCLLIEVEDDAPSESLPPIALMLAGKLGIELLEQGGNKRGKRELIFKADLP